MQNLEVQSFAISTNNAHKYFPVKIMESSIPIEISQLILSFADKKSIKSFALTSSNWQKAIFYVLTRKESAFFHHYIDDLCKNPHLMDRKGNLYDLMNRVFNSVATVNDVFLIKKTLFHKIGLFLKEVSSKEPIRKLNI